MKDSLFEEFPFVDFAFGPGNIHRLGEYITAGGAFPRGHFSTFDNFAGSLPLKRDRPHQAWLQISTGCNCNCTYCIVPSVRGRERSRHPEELAAEATALAADGVIELTLLGQNVNAYGRDLRPQLATSFAQLLRDLDAIDGIGRIRYTSPHPKDMRADVIAAMAECDAVCEQLHLPVQSGSTRVLKAMRRTYSRERYLKVVADVRAAIPQIALTTDIIVGFPGETDADFEHTLSLYDEVGYDHAFTFVFSPRRGTEAAKMEDQVPDAVKKERIQRLVDLVQSHAARRNRELEGTVQEVLVEGPSRHRPVGAAGTLARQQGGQLPRGREAGRPGGGRDRLLDQPNAGGPPSGDRRSLTVHPVVAIFGPTASGKSALALELAHRLDAEIVSCDAMQVYRGLPILTNQPTPDELAAVPHHLVGIWPLEHAGIGGGVRAARPRRRGRRDQARPAGGAGGGKRAVPAGGGRRSEGPTAARSGRPGAVLSPV